MAGFSNNLKVEFTPCTPAPANGYNLQYRPVGSTGPYRNAGNFSASPAIVSGINDPEGTHYEGFIRSDCGGGSYGGQVHFNTGGGGGCMAVTSVSKYLPDGRVGVLYEGYVLLNGTPPFTVQNELVPAWLTLTPLADRVNITGTPTQAAGGTGERVSFWVKNCDETKEIKSQNSIVILP